VIDIQGGRFVLREKLPQINFDDLQGMTGAVLHLDGPILDLIEPEV